MMSMNVINNIAYYEELAKEDYYTKGGEPLGKWVGKGRHALKLTNHINSRDYRRIFNGFSLDGTALCKNAGENHRSGWDLTFSAPKSVSILWARADKELRDQIQKAQQNATEQALSFIEEHSAITRRGKGGKTHERVAGLIAATFEHSTSRAQDPQLHTHCLIANIAPRTDGTWGTLESKQLFLWQKASGAIYRSQLANALCDLGFDIERNDNYQHFEVKGIPNHVCNFFSKRAEVIRLKMKELGVSNSSSKIGDAITLNSRAYKKAIDRPLLFSSWQTEMDNLGFDINKLSKLKQLNRNHSIEPLPLSKILNDLTQEQAVFRLQDIYACTAREAQFQTAELLNIEDTVREVLDSKLIIKLGIDINNNQMYTTQEMLNIENKLIRNAELLNKDYSFQLDEKDIFKAIKELEQKKEFSLSDEQIEAVFSVCQSGLDIIQGKAGAGKSTSMQAMRIAYEAKGFNVYGATIARQAAQQLEADTGIRSTTLANLLQALEKRKSKIENSVILLDEAGQLPTPELLRLMEKVHSCGSKLVLVGEQQQLDAITHGGTLRYLSQRQGFTGINTIRRQREEWARKAVNDLRSGDIQPALRAFIQKGLLHIEKDNQSAREKLVDCWAKYSKENPHKETMLLAQRWRDVKPLNDLVRKEFKAQNKLGSEDIMINCVVSNQSLCFSFSAGERVRFTKNDYKRDFTNGEKGTITKVKQLSDDVRFTIKLDNGRVVSFNQSDYSDSDERLHLVQAYASTVYSAQGATVDGDTFILYNTGMDRAATYVAGSRHKDNCHWFVNSGELDMQSGLKDLGVKSDLETQLTTLQRCMSTNRHKKMALEYLNEVGVDNCKSIKFELT